jgi:acetate---CoA ligase (ADP-forming)
VSRSVADLLFRPRSIVIYGASSDPDKLSGRPLDYLKKFGFKGHLYAVNPRRTEVQGVQAYAKIADVPGPVDLAIVVIPAPAVVEAVRACADAGVGAAIIFASGFAEIGEQGTQQQAEISAIARRSGMRVVGPNCLGSFAATDRAFATFSTAFDEDGERPVSPIALASQSGAVGTFTYSTMNALGLGVTYFANTGNEADVTVTEVLSALVDAPDVEVLMGHIEGGKDMDALATLASAAKKRGKPLIILKSGRTPAGARAVAAHTASVAGDDAAFEAVLATHGAVRVPSMEAMADSALALADGRRAAGRRLTIVTLSGGGGALAADRAVELGLNVDTWGNEHDRAALAAELPYFGSTKNPVDVTGAMINDLSLLERTLHIVNDNEDTHAVLVLLGNADRGAAEIVATLTNAHRTTSKPFLVAWTGGSGRPRISLLKAGVPTYTDPHRAVECMSRIVEFSLQPAPASVSPPGYRQSTHALCMITTSQERDLCQSPTSRSLLRSPPTAGSRACRLRLPGKRRGSCWTRSAVPWHRSTLRRDEWASTTVGSWEVRETRRRSSVSASGLLFMGRRLLTLN